MTEINGQKNLVRFNKDLAKKVAQETFSDNGPADSQGIEIKSPGKMHWFTIKGDSIDDIIEVQTATLFDPDGEQQDYLIQAEEKSLREKICNKADDNFSTKLIIRCINWFGTEFLWMPSIKTKLSKQSAEKAIKKGLAGWIKCKWRSNSVGWQSWSHPSNSNPEIRKPEWCNMGDEEIIDQVFDERIITTLDHEALERNVGGL
tara:strand:+ start:1720 stop:2328 length:609 start_codon:yes stop_codon:yes gene_type:complete